MNAIPPPPPESRWPYVLNIAVFVQLLVAVALTWGYAWINGELPDADAMARYERTGNGPWNHHPTMTLFVNYVFLAATITAVTGIIAFIATRSTKYRAFAALSVLASLGAFAYHFWLID